MRDSCRIALNDSNGNNIVAEPQSGKVVYLKAISNKLYRWIWNGNDQKKTTKFEYIDRLGSCLYQERADTPLTTISCNDKNNQEWRIEGNKVTNGITSILISN